MPKCTHTIDAKVPHTPMMPQYLTYNMTVVTGANERVGARAAPVSCARTNHPTVGCGLGCRHFAPAAACVCRRRAAPSYTHMSQACGLCSMRDVSVKTSE